MEWANLIVSFGLLALTGAAAVAALLQARVAVEARREAQSARSEAEKARDETIGLAREATTALKRSAAADERANELRAAALPAPKVAWELEWVDNQRYLVRNVGDFDIEDATLSSGDDDRRSNMIIPDVRTPQRVTVGDSLGFLRSARLSTGAPTVRVSFTHPQTGEIAVWQRRVD